MIDKTVKDKLNNLKYEIATEVGVSYDTQGHSRDITAREAGKIGGQMVKRMIEAYKNNQ